MSDYPKDFPESQIKEVTTDINIFSRAIEGKKIIESFLSALIDSSIDCTAHYSSLPAEAQNRVNCKICRPSGCIRFHPLLSTDMKIPDPCQEISKTKIKAKKIKDMN